IDFAVAASSLCDIRRSVTGRHSSRGRDVRLGVDASPPSKEDGMKGLIPAVGLGLLWAVAAAAQEPKPSPSPSPAKPQDETVKRAETVVVTASKTAPTLINAPATTTVGPRDGLLASLAHHYGALVRPAPGVDALHLS